MAHCVCTILLCFPLCVPLRARARVADVPSKCSARAGSAGDRLDHVDCVEMIGTHHHHVTRMLHKHPPLVHISYWDRERVCVCVRMCVCMR
jgi:hypothetical protein